MKAPWRNRRPNALGSAAPSLTTSSSGPVVRDGIGRCKLGASTCLRSARSRIFRCPPRAPRSIRALAISPRSLGAFVCERQHRENRRSDRSRAGQTVAISVAAEGTGSRERPAQAYRIGGIRVEARRSGVEPMGQSAGDGASKRQSGAARASGRGASVGAPPPHRRCDRRRWGNQRLSCTRAGESDPSGVTARLRAIPRRATTRYFAIACCPPRVTTRVTPSWRARAGSSTPHREPAPLTPARYSLCTCPSVSRATAGSTMTSVEKQHARSVFVKR